MRNIAGRNGVFQNLLQHLLSIFKIIQILGEMVKAKITPELY